MADIQRADRRSPLRGSQLAWLILSVAGIGISIYLTIVHYSGAGLVCSTTGLINCERVLSSPYSLVPFTSIPITIPGMLWFLVSGTLGFIGWRGLAQLRPLSIAEVAWSGLGLLSIFYLVYAEIVKVQAICVWCTVVHLLILSMLLISVVQLQRSSSVDDIDDEEADEEAEEATISSRHEMPKTL
ncbi:MAG TPA: vitamin K epoxide reductase family protein [Ktedonosporobacter sp.]|nr:vitamin K epoxide reductase family protein [Ktedonosporobacter sp.]